MLPYRHMAVEDKVQRNFFPAIIPNIFKREIPWLHPKVAETSPNTDHVHAMYVDFVLKEKYVCM